MVFRLQSMTRKGGPTAHRVAPARCGSAALLLIVIPVVVGLAALTISEPEFKPQR